MTDILASFGYLALGTRLRRLGERLQADTQRIIDAQGMAVQAGQFPLLATLEKLGATTVGDLAEALGVSQPGVTRMLAELERLDLVHRTPSTEDQRRTLVMLSEAGTALVTRASVELWPLVEAAVREICEAQHGTLLEQIGGVEAGLVARSLPQRAGITP